VEKPQNQLQCHLEVTPNESERECYHDDANSVVSGGDMLPLPTNMSVFDQGFEVVPQVKTVSTRGIRKDNYDECEVALPSLAPPPPTSRNGNQKKVETLQCQSLTPAATENMDPSIHANVHLLPSVDGPRGITVIDRDTSCETQLPTLMPYHDLVIETNITDYDSAASSNCHAQRSRCGKTQLPSSTFYRDLVIEPVSTDVYSATSSYCHAPSGRRGPSPFIGSHFRMVPHDPPTFDSGELISSPVKRYHRGENGSRKGRSAATKITRRMSDESEQTVVDRDEKKNDIIACPRKFRKMDVPLLKGQGQIADDANELQNEEIASPVGFAYPCHSHDVVAFIMPSPSSYGLMATNCIFPETYGESNHLVKACLAPTETGDDDDKDFDQRMKFVLPSLLPSMSLPQEISPIRQKILIKQFFDDTLSPCTACFLTLVESLELEFFKPLAKKKRGFVSVDNVVDPGAQIEMVLNEGQLPSSDGNRNEKNKYKKDMKNKDKKNISSSNSKLRPSLPRTKRFVPPPLINPSTKHKRTNLATSNGRTMSRMAPIVEEPHQYRDDEDDNDDNDDTIDLDDKDETNSGRFSIFLESSNDSMVPKVGSTASF
jgi:hypothetical protein